MSKDTEIVLIGMRETMTALDKFDKEAVLGFEGVIEATLGAAAAQAAGFVPFQPMSGWMPKGGVSLGSTPTSAGAMRRQVKAARALGTGKKKTSRGGAGFPYWNQGTAIAGIKTSRKVGKVRRDYTTSAGAVIQNDAAGAIFEVAGRRGSTSQFTKNLDRFHRASRAVWRAIDNDQHKYELAIYGALEKAKLKLHERLNTEKG